MDSKLPPQCPDSNMDEKKRKRKLSNRESARRSRMKKQQRVDELITQKNQLQEEDKKLRQKIDEASKLYLDFSSKNNVLRAQVMELTGCLRSLNSVLEIASVVSGQSVDILDILDTLLEPWQTPCPVALIPASADMFQC